MNLGGRLWALLRVDDDALAPYRDRIALLLSWLSAALLLPFTLLHAMQGRVLLVLAIGLVQAVLVVDAWALHRSRRPPVPYALMGCVFVAGVCSSIALQGINGSFWAYPTIFILYFILRRSVALLLSAALVVGVTAVAWWVLGPPIAVRLLATLLLTLVMVNVVLNVIGDLQRALQHQAITDALTGAFNRRHLETELSRLVAGDRSASCNAMLAIDVDHFKRINDRFGHATGDEVLKRVVAELTARKRKGDTLFRTGGEEFVLLLPGASRDDALRAAESLRQRIEQAELLPGEVVTVSIGLATRRADQPVADWARGADQALYEAKRQGRNRVVVSAA
jgi:diguanylate cyclase (GGDEF)-like protein